MLHDAERGSVHEIHTPLPEHVPEPPRTDSCSRCGELVKEQAALDREQAALAGLVDTGAVLTSDRLSHSFGTTNVGDRAIVHRELVRVEWLTTSSSHVPEDRGDSRSTKGHPFETRSRNHLVSATRPLVSASSTCVLILASIALSSTRTMSP
jgi:hypothetical protein